MCILDVWQISLVHFLHHKTFAKPILKNILNPSFLLAVSQSDSSLPLLACYWHVTTVCMHDTKTKQRSLIYLLLTTRSCVNHGWLACPVFLGSVCCAHSQILKLRVCEMQMTGGSSGENNQTSQQQLH